MESWNLSLSSPSGLPNLPFSVGAVFLFPPVLLPLVPWRERPWERRGRERKELLAWIWNSWWGSLRRERLQLCELSMPQENKPREKHRKSVSDSNLWPVELSWKRRMMCSEAVDTWLWTVEIEQEEKEASSGFHIAQDFSLRTFRENNLGSDVSSDDDDVDDEARLNNGLLSLKPSFPVSPLKCVCRNRSEEKRLWCVDSPFNSLGTKTSLRLDFEEKREEGLATVGLVFVVLDNFHWKQELLVHWQKNIKKTNSTGQQEE